MALFERKPEYYYFYNNPFFSVIVGLPKYAQLEIFLIGVVFDKDMNPLHIL